MSVKGSTPQAELVAAASVAESTEIPRRERLKLVRTHGFREADRTIAPSSRARARARERVRAVDAAGLQLVCLTDSGYPRLLKAAPDPPFLLTLWGELTPDDALALAVVGSRRATPYGLEMSRRLACELSSAGLAVVSGLARGIDAAAHRGALESGGRTIAILGSGLHNVYPREHGRLAEQIAQRGAVISEFGLDEPPHARNFPRRNRIITGMSLGTLVVEAASKSGSLVSARLAMEQDRDVFAVPGPARAPNSEGVHALIRDGAKLVTEARDVLEELRPEVRALLRSVTSQENERDEGLNEGEHAVLSTLRSLADASDVDELVERTDIPIAQVMATLSSLEVKGMVWSLRGGLYQAKP